MKNKPYPGKVYKNMRKNVCWWHNSGQEEQLQKRLHLSGEADAESEQKSTVHSLVTTFRVEKRLLEVKL